MSIGIMDLFEIFSRRFDSLIVESGKTAESIARALSITPQSVSELRKGSTKPKLITAYKIADYFGISIDYLVGRTNEADRKGYVNDV